MKYFALVLFFAGFVFISCNKNNDPVLPDPEPPTNDSIVEPPAPVDSATGIVVVTYANLNGVVDNSLICLNADGSLRWKNDKFNGEVLQAPGYANGTLYVSTSIFRFTGPVGSNSYYSYGKLYAIDASNGSVKWSHLDSSLGSATPLATNSQVYLPQNGYIAGFHPTTGVLNWGALVTNGLPWTPLIDGDTLYTATAPMYTAYYSITALNVKTNKVLWTKPVGYNPPGGFKIVNNMLVLTTGAGALMALDKTTGMNKWTVSDQPYDAIHIANGNTLFTFNHTSPLNLYAFSLTTGALQWKTNLQKVPYQFRGLYLYRNNLYFNAINHDNTTYLQAVNPKTGDSISRANLNDRYEDPLYIGHRVYAKKWWDNATNNQLAIPQVVILNASNYALQHATDINADQIRSIRVIGKSGVIY